MSRLSLVIRRQLGLCDVNQNPGPPLPSNHVVKVCTDSPSWSTRFRLAASHRFQWKPMAGYPARRCARTLRSVPYQQSRPGSPLGAVSPRERWRRLNDSRSSSSLASVLDVCFSIRSRDELLALSAASSTRVGQLHTLELPEERVSAESYGSSTGKCHHVSMNTSSSAAVARTDEQATAP